METQEKKSPHTLFWIAGIAVTLFSAVGVAAIMGWIPTSTSSPAEGVALVMPPAAPTRPAIVSSSTARSRERAREQAREDARARSPVQAPVQVADASPAKCVECGVVQSVREVATKGEGSGIGAVGGAVVGGVLGHQVGGGRGQDIATAGGAVAGAAVGSSVGSGYGAGQDVQHCTNVTRDGQPDYWDVTYVFEGREHRVQMTTAPGATILVNRNGEPRV
jgi:uncharacterized protein YcfJ